MEPVISLNQLIKNLATIVNVQTDTAAQQQALLSTQTAIDTMTQTLLTKHQFPISQNCPIHELTAQVIEEENLNNLNLLIDTVQDLSTYGATSEFFISTIRLLQLQQGGGWC